MKQNKAQGTWGIRFLIHLFTAALTILVFWLLGFLVKDIESMKGPDYAEIERRHIDQSVLMKKDLLEKQIAEKERLITNKREEQRLAGDSSLNLQRTINQLLELQKLSIQKAVSLTEAEKENLSVSLKHFLESQKKYQELNKSIADLTSQKLQLDDEKRRIDQQVEQQRKPAHEEFEGLARSHHLRLALYQLFILVPLLLIASYLSIRKRRSIYFPLLLAFGAATLLKVGFVIHEYLPSRYFKYVLTVTLMIVVARILVYLIRIIAFPKVDWLMRQYREAYERFLCPVCNYPIRVGPRKFLYWTRRTVHKILPQQEFVGKDEAYTCPSCGTGLFEQCPSCQQIRHSLLFHCDHCGAKKEIK